MFTCRDGKHGEQLSSSEVNIASYDELFDQSECPILIFASGNYTKDKYHHVILRGVLLNYQLVVNLRKTLVFRMGKEENQVHFWSVATICGSTHMSTSRNHSLCSVLFESL